MKKNYEIVCYFFSLILITARWNSSNTKIEFVEDNEVDKNGNIIGESYAFFETTMMGFKTSIRLEAEYCINEQCTTEIFKIKYLR